MAVEKVTHRVVVDLPHGTRFLRVHDVIFNLPYVVLVEHIPSRQATIIQYVVGSTTLKNDRHEMDDSDRAFYHAIANALIS